MENASQTSKVSLRKITSKTVRKICELNVSDNERFGNCKRRFNRRNQLF